MPVAIEYLNNMNRVNVLSLGQAILDSERDAAIIHGRFTQLFGTRGGVIKYDGFESFQGFSASAIFSVNGTTYVAFQF